MPANRKRTATKKNTKAATYRVLIGFQFPADADVRRRLKDGEDIPPGDQGEIVRYLAGATFELGDIPAEVFAACAHKNALKVVGNKSKEASAQ